MKRALPFLIVGVVTLLAIACGWGTNLLVVGPLLSVPAGPDIGNATAPLVAANDSAGAPRNRAMTKQQYIDGILRRNIFDHTQIGVVSGPGGDGEVKTDLNIKLLSTIVADPEVYSSALIIEEEQDAVSRSYGIGQQIEDAKIVKIEKQRVTLERGDGTQEVLEMSEGKTVKRTSSSKPRPGDSEEGDGVAEVGDNKYEIDRELVEKYLTDIDQISRMGRALPHKDANGEIDGYRLSGIRRRSVASQLGIRNGDIVHSVNGHNLTSMKEAMEAWGSLQNESSFSFEVTRRGQKMNMEYTIR